MDFLGFYFILIFVVIMWLLLVRQKRRYAQLVLFLNGKYSLFGTISFEIQHRKFHILNVGTGNFSTGMGGSYHKLQLETGKKMKFFLGPRTAYKYVSIGKVPDSFQDFSIQGREFIVRSETLEATEDLKNQILQNQDLQTAVVDLLKKDFQYLRSSSITVFEKFYLKKKFYIELSFIEHSCLKNFDELHPLFRQFLFICGFLK